MFDKEIYRTRREQGLRGQGDPLKAPVTPLEPAHQGQHGRPVNGKLERVNRAESRRRVIDRRLTKKGYAYGRMAK